MEKVLIIYVDGKKQDLIGDVSFTTNDDTNGEEMEFSSLLRYKNGNIVKVTVNKLFGKTNELTYEAYVAMFSREKESMGWLISTKGIRSALEENNV